ncbi:hypothetical protein EDD15DRAFT_1561585 [Pisolithus albus]|nr:hypothetical protein EDD15DRAFT_1561585 [Pisolithus albus]
MLSGSSSSRRSIATKSSSPAITTTTTTKSSTNPPATQPGSQTMAASQKPLPPALRTSALRSTQPAVPSPTQGRAATSMMAAPPIPRPLMSPTASQSAPPPSTPITASKAPSPLSVSGGPSSMGPPLPTADPRLHSPSVPANTTTGDRLAPIRAAKAALQGPSSNHEPPSGVNLGVANGNGVPQGVQDFWGTSRSSTPQQLPTRNVHSTSFQPSQTHANGPWPPEDRQRSSANLPPRPSHAVQQASLNTQDSFGKPRLLTEEPSTFPDVRNSSHRSHSPLFYRDSHSQSPVSHQHQRSQPHPHSYQQQSGSIQGHGMSRQLPPPPQGPSSARPQYPPSTTHVPHAHTGVNMLPPRPPPEVQRSATLPYPNHRLPPGGTYAESDRRWSGSEPERRQGPNDQRTGPTFGSGAYDHDPSGVRGREWDRDRVRDRDWNYPPPSRPRAERPPGRGRGRGG